MFASCTDITSGKKYRVIEDIINENNAKPKPESMINPAKLPPAEDSP